MLITLTGLMVMTACVSTSPTARSPHIPHELRGLWVATVDNADWPSSRDLTPEQQRRELVAIFDRAAALHLNAIFLQIRPAADALYPSPLEPWSEYLTGKMGKAPEPFYDPLAFAVTEAHARGLELHAWFNPFRAHHPSGTSEPDPRHVLRAHPERVHPYGPFVWMDPGDEDVQRESLAVIVDVVRRYDVDGVHLDDYFYPYPEHDANGQRIDFPDIALWDRYVAAGGRLSREDWRRDNINRFVRELYTTVKSIRPRVVVGISPFGIWRPGNPAQIQGFDAWSDLYADARLWLQQGWVDYMAPQLYWGTDQREQSFPVLLRWWVEQDKDKDGRRIAPGLAIYRVSGSSRGLSAEEIARQIGLIREERRAGGFILFSARTLMEDCERINAVLGAAIEAER
ncbi:MAG TPA: family 10 glycosylhydrolase [Thermoanaerobaculia bacterium]|nr:family 10 glycosylhydrolase [Thermoanaerobaculia bacterium]